MGACTTSIFTQNTFLPVSPNTVKHECAYQENKLQCYLSLQLKLNGLLHSKCIFHHLKFLTSCLHFTIPGLEVTSVVFRLDTQYLSRLSQILAWFKSQATLSKKKYGSPEKFLQGIPCYLVKGPCPKTQSILYHNSENVCLAHSQNSWHQFLFFSH